MIRRWPPIPDPVAGGGAIPLEAQWLGLTALDGGLSPVVVLIHKAMIELSPRFAGMPPVHPDIGKALITCRRARAEAADVEAYGRWMRDEAEWSIGHLCPEAAGRLDPPQVHPACRKPPRARGTSTGADVPA